MGSRLHIPRSLIAEYVADHPELERHSRAFRNLKNTTPRYSDEELIDLLQHANRGLGGILAASAFTAYGRERTLPDGRRWPTHQTPALRFGSWRAAPEKAGLAANRSSPIAGQRIFQREHCIDALLEAGRELGHLPSAMEYESWAADQGGTVPSLATLRHRCGGWQAALQLADAFSR